MDLIWLIDDWYYHWCHYLVLKKFGFAKSNTSEGFGQVSLVPTLVPRVMAPVAKNYLQDNF
jgi:hypothetical protein